MLNYLKHLDVDFSWGDVDIKTCLPVFLTLLFFVLFWFTTQSPRLKSFFHKKTKHAHVSFFFFSKVFGFFCFGVFPLLFCLFFIPSMSFCDYGLIFIPKTALFSFFWILLLSIVVVPLAFYSAKKDKNLKNYPQIRANVWTKKTLFISLLGWFLYLLGYEFLFRGVLFFPLVSSIGVWPSIFINISLYSATHIPKGLDETLGAIPLGIVLCVLTLYSGTIWIAFFVHLAMAWTNNLTSLKYNTNITFQKNGRQQK